MLRTNKIAICNTSNAQKETWKPKLERLTEILKDLGIEIQNSRYIFGDKDEFSGTGYERASELNRFYRDDTISAIFDISGGDLSNETLEYIDFEAIGRSDKTFYGYSDLSTVINSIYAKTGKASVLYQIRHRCIKTQK